MTILTTIGLYFVIAGMVIGLLSSVTISYKKYSTELTVIGVLWIFSLLLVIGILLVFPLTYFIAKAKLNILT